MRHKVVAATCEPTGGRTMPIRQAATVTLAAARASVRVREAKLTYLPCPPGGTGAAGSRHHLVPPQFTAVSVPVSRNTARDLRYLGQVGAGLLRDPGDVGCVAAGRRSCLAMDVRGA